MQIHKRLHQICLFHAILIKFMLKLTRSRKSNFMFKLHCFFRHSRNLCPKLRWFVAFTSSSAFNQTKGQSSYYYANSVLESIIEKRKLDGLPAFAIGWGLVADVGLAFRTFKNAPAAGALPQSVDSYLKVIPECFHNCQA